MIERIHEALKKGSSEAPRATTPKLTLESTWITFGSPLLLPNREPDKEELPAPPQEAHDEPFGLDH